MKLLNKKIYSNKIFPPLFSVEPNSAKNFFCGHIGSSMNPTLTAQDLLEIKPYQQEDPQIGDVVLFQPRAHNHFVVHRITRINAAGIRTRGDNNGEIDSYFLDRGDIYGRVTAAHHGSQCRKITGGFIGRLTGFSCLVRRNTTKLAVKLLRPVYRAFCPGGILRWLIPVQFTPHVVTFQSDVNASYRLLLGKRIIGTYDNSILQWQIRRPYRLFVDESSLPTPG
jgi:signal peptidase